MTPKFVDRIIRKLGYVPDEVTRNLTCAWCGESFTWSGHARDNHPSFCKHSHRNRASEARKKRFERSQEQKPPRKAPEPPKDLNMVGRCPTPFKQTHRSFESAMETIQRVDPAMHPYRCQCGGIHIGHRKKTKR